MKLTDEKLDHNRVNRLEDQLYWCIRDFYKNEAGQVTQQEFQEEGLLALAITLAEHIASIDCLHCRQHAAKVTKREMPRMVAEALAEGARRDETRPSSVESAHSH